jgi:hypothetical protein
LLGRATSDDFSTTLARKSLDTSDDRRRIDDEEMIGPLHNRSDSTLLCVAVSMSETFGAENVV